MKYTYIAVAILVTLVALSLFLLFDPQVREKDVAAALCSAYCYDHKNLTYGTCITNNISFGYACEYASTNVCNASSYVLLSEDCKILKIS